MMILPSDNLLKKHGAIRSETIDGAECYIRDYKAYLLADERGGTAFAIIQKAFIKKNYPLNDLSQTMKQLNNQSIMDEADGIAKDAKTMLLESVQPDIILELDYSYDMDINSRNFARRVVYTITAIDAYTNKVFSSNTYTGDESTDFSEAFADAIDENMSDIMGEIQDYFNDIVENGREIIVRYTIDKGSPIKFSDVYSTTGETYSEWIQDYMDYCTIDGTYKLERNSEYELYFVNVRIPTQLENGTQLNSLRWARQCIKEMREKLGVICTNRSQGLSEVVITLNK